jgi:uncharacterized Fe-S cluster-containing radical SAM superfamily enzyme
MVIKVSQNINALTGQGAEYLLDASGEVIAYFYDGNMVRASESIDAEAQTVGVA